MTINDAEKKEARGIYPKRVILVLGGARSGKSALAQRLAEELGPSPLYLATARVDDEEMAERVAKHRKNRGDHWQTLEEPIALTSVICGIPAAISAILVDCLTLWLSNLLISGDEESSLVAVQNLIKIFPQVKSHLVLVSNEVGMGIVPDNPLARRFRDLSGAMNQMVAAAADEVYLVAAGLPLKIK